MPGISNMLCLTCCDTLRRLLKVSSQHSRWHSNGGRSTNNILLLKFSTYTALPPASPSHTPPLLGYICYKSLSLSIFLPYTADSDAETDEDEGHIEDAEKAQQREREKHDESEELSNKDIQDTDEEVAVSLLRAKNLSLLQSQ